MTLDLYRLEQLAQAAHPEARWLTATDRALSRVADYEAALIAAASPDVILALCKVARAAMEWRKYSDEGWDVLDDALREAGL